MIAIVGKPINQLVWWDGIGVFLMAHVVTAPDWADVLARGSFCQYIYLTAWLSCIDIERFRMIQISWKWWDCIAHTAEILQNHGLFTLDGACWFLECVSFKCVWKPLQWPESFRSFVEIVLAYLERLMKPAMCQQTLGPKPFEPWTHLEMSEIPQRVSRISILFRSLGCQAFARSSELPAWFERTVDRRDTVTLDAIVTIWWFTITYYHFPWHANLSMYAITQNYSEGRLSGIHEKKSWWLW